MTAEPSGQASWVVQGEEKVGQREFQGVEEVVEEVEEVEEVVELEEE
eukprot:gene12859-15195_t